MRSLVLASLALVSCSRAAPGPHHYLTIDVDAIATARDATTEPVDVIEQTGDIAVIDFPEADLDALSAKMDAEHHRCGGFLLHDTLAEAEATALPARGPVDYKLDHGKVLGEILPELDEAKILATIRELSAMPNRYYASETGAAASTWLAARWRSFSTRTDVTIELVDHGYPQRSVIMTIPGTTRASEVVVIGGHLDSITMRGRTGAAPGADDDASGIATLTEVARVVLAHDYHPSRTVKFIAYAAEEIGLRGSQAIVKDFTKRKIDVVGALQLDMTNFQGSDTDIWLMKDFTSPVQNEFLVRLIDTYVKATWGLDSCGYACSDHASWFRAGVPASMPFESRMAQRNKKIHSANDTLETSGNNARHALKFAALGAAYVIELAKGELHAKLASNR